MINFVTGTDSVYIFVTQYRIQICRSVSIKTPQSVLLSLTVLEGYDETV